jgi:hypothetical protein
MYPFPPSSFYLFIYLGKKKTLTSTPLPFNSKKKKKKNQLAPFPPSHNEFVKKITPSLPHNEKTIFRKP